MQERVTDARSYGSLGYFAYLLACLLFLSACGGGSSSPSPTAPTPQPRFSIIPSITGLVGSGLVLQNNGGDDLAVLANSSIGFSTTIVNGSNYGVSIKTQPTSPSQTCVAANATGTVASANVVNVTVTCTTNTFQVGGNVSGLVGSGLVLQRNGSDDLAVTSSGAINFSTVITSGSNYDITVKTQPTSPSQACVVTNATGTVASANVANVTVTCTTNTYRVGGNVIGLVGSGLVLQKNNSDDLAVLSNGAISFATVIASGSSYDVSVKTQPTSPSQTCVVANATGTITSDNVVSTAVTCTTNTYQVGGNILGLVGSGLVLQNNGANNLAVTANGMFNFNVPVSSSQPYSVSILSQPLNPAQRCEVTNSTGSVTATDIATVNVTCVKIFAISGTISGLNGSGLMLQNNSGDALAANANGGFSFSTELTTGASYHVAVGNQPSAPVQTCTVTGGDGVVADADIATVAITCRNDHFVYVASGPSDTITAFTINSATGFLTQMPGSPYALSGYPSEAEIDPTGRYMYVTTFNSNAVQGYSIDNISGALSPVAGSPFATGSQPLDIAMDPSGRSIFISNYGLSSVSAFTIGDLTGSLTAVSGSPFTVGGSPRELTVNPSGKFLFVPSQTANAVWGFSIDPLTSVLSPIAGSPFFTGSGGPNQRASSVRTDTVGNTAYVVHQAPDSFSALHIDGTTGVLTPLAGSPFTTTSQAGSMAIDPLGRFAFFTNFNGSNGTVSIYSINSVSGALSEIAGSPVATRGAGASTPAVTPDGTFVLVTNVNGASVAVFAIDAVSGLLSHVPGSPFPVAFGPQGIAIR